MHQSERSCTNQGGRVPIGRSCTNQLRSCTNQEIMHQPVEVMHQSGGSFTSQGVIHWSGGGACTNQEIMHQPVEVSTSQGGHAPIRMLFINQRGHAPIRILFTNQGGHVPIRILFTNRGSCTNQDFIHNQETMHQMARSCTNQGSPCTN